MTFTHEASVPQLRGVSVDIATYIKTSLKPVKHKQITSKYLNREQSSYMLNMYATYHAHCFKTTGTTGCMQLNLYTQHTRGTIYASLLSNMQST